MKPIALALLLLFSIIPFLGIANNDSVPQNNKHFHIETSFDYGFIMPHRPAMQYYVLGHIPAFELKFLKQTTGNKEWQNVWRNPEIGTGAYFASLNNSENLGNVYAIYAFIRIPIIRNKKVSFNYEISPGCAYLTKSFNQYTNYYNTAIGSGLNFYFNFSFPAYVKLSNRLEFMAAIGFKHYSNGAFKLPNLGINVISANTGIKYLLTKNPSPIIFRQSGTFLRHWEFSTIYSAGTKQMIPPGQKNYFTSSISLNLHRAYNAKRKLGFGIDQFYDPTLKKWYENKNDTTANNLYSLRTGFVLSQDLSFGHFSILIQAGAYIIDKVNTDGLLYHRIALRYTTNKNLIINFSLKSHFAKADFIEWGIGYKIPFH